MNTMETSAAPSGVGAILWLLAMAGCDHNLGVLDGTDLGEPQAAAFHHSPDSRLMVVLSDLPGLCDDLHDNEAPEVGDWWVVSLWTGSSASVEGEYPADGFAALTRGGEVTELNTTTADLDVRDQTDTSISGRVDLSFSNGDRLGARFNAELCEAALFQGME